MPPLRCRWPHVRNPLPATGGTEPEPVEQVRQLAPLDLRRTRLRAVTAADYAELATGLPGVQRAAAEIRWTGSVQEAHVAIDAARTGEPSPQLLDSVAYALESYRRIGHDLVVEMRPGRFPWTSRSRYVRPPAINTARSSPSCTAYSAIDDCPAAGFGFFHPDALTFGEPVRLSRLTAVAAAVPGVRSVRVTRLQRLFAQEHSDNRALEDGVLRLGPLEIAVCDNDPERPENGRLVIGLGGTGERGGAR